jgi:hypothetical protein
MLAEYLQPSKLPRSGKNYVIIGYPHSKNRFSVATQTVIASPYAYRSDSISDEEYGKYGVTPESHVILPLSRKEGFDTSGNLTTFPKPAGMSGSPVIALYGDGTEESRVFPVVAVAIEYREKQKILIATDVKYVIEAMANAA